MATVPPTYRPHPEELEGNWPHRSTIRGTRHAAVCGHYLSAQAAFSVLEAGGNAIDAGVAAGLVEGVVQPDQVNIAGVAPILVYLAEAGAVVTISGLGGWPKAARCELFEREYKGTIPEGILRTVVPAAPAAWLMALERYGTMTFGEVADFAIRLARDGFPIHAFTAAEIRKRADHYRRWPSNAAIFLPKGQHPEPGDLFVQADLGRTLQYLADSEKSAAKRGRAAGLKAVYDAFYRGDVAAAMVDFHRAEGGLLTLDDLAEFRVSIEPSTRLEFGGKEVHTCGFWSQAPVLLQALSLLAGFDLRNLGHNSAQYVHVVAEALKLSFADRERFYGDPRFVDVPAAALLSADYAAARRSLIRSEMAWPEMPPAGDPSSAGAVGSVQVRPLPAAEGLEPVPDTSYVCTVDSKGNIFSASPSDPSYNTVVIPGLGLCPSSRGCQSWADSSHPSSVAPGKRPRLTPMPALALEDRRPYLAFGTPGGDVQPQAMLQVFLNIAVFGMDPQVAVEAPRFVSRSMPDSFEPHSYFPGQLNLESRLPRSVGDSLSEWGHDVQWWPERTSRAGGVCALQFDRIAGVFHAGADFRRMGYALGW